MGPSRFRILLLGGYGNFGARIARRLAGDAGIELVIAGRSAQRAAQLSAALAGHCSSTAFDANGSLALLTSHLREHSPQLVINACGPFQGRDYRLAEAAIAIGAHYVDLADARTYVAGFGRLDAAAHRADVLAVTGASTVPGLTAAVIDSMRGGLVRIDAIDCGISPGNRTERGLATVAAILSYVGRPIQVWRDGRWQPLPGWQDCGRHRYPEPMGTRWLAACDVPDLELFPQRYGARAVRFRAGLELSLLHLGLWSLSWLSRVRLVPDWSRHAALLCRLSRWFDRFGTDVGGMHLSVRGSNAQGHALEREWMIVAGGGDGPEIPATPAVVLAKKLARGELAARGARPCLDLFSLDEFLTALEGLDIRVTCQTHALR